jgi:hypothetical protein
MTKLVVTLNGLMHQEFVLTKSRINIGRRSTNDLALDHITVSGQHAAIDTTLNGAFVLDLGSTNGTKVNGQPIKKHLLQSNDTIEVGKYKIKFVLETNAPIASSDDPNATQVFDVAQVSKTLPQAKIKVLNGNNAGREMVLTKQVSNMGNPAVLVISIIREKDGYFIKFVEGVSAYRINETAMDKGSHLLKDGDVIDLAGTKLVFAFVS